MHKSVFVALFVFVSLASAQSFFGTWVQRPRNPTLNITLTINRDSTYTQDNDLYFSYPQPEHTRTHVEGRIQAVEANGVRMLCTKDDGRSVSECYDGSQFCVLWKISGKWKLGWFKDHVPTDSLSFVGGSLIFVRKTK